MWQFFVLLLTVISSHAGKPWMKLGQTPSQRAQALLAEMQQTDKLAMVHGYDTVYAGEVVVSNATLGIPVLHLEDGPSGVSDGVYNVTAWPSALTVVATWDVNMMQDYAVGIAQEERAKGTNVWLGPMVNIARVPMGGRNFESFGEDPYLASQMVAASVMGVQSQGVIATVKHFVNNNQEYNRTLTSANVDERTNYEIYYPAFQAAVDAGVGSVMCSYNRINDTYACENAETLLTALKTDMGFTGWVMSDWGATHSTINAANNGLDMQMPDDSFFGANLAAAIANGSVPQSRLDDMVLRILTPMFAVGLFDNPQTGNLSVNVQSAAHTELAFTLAAAATVLLKNEGSLLPLTPLNGNIAVLGDNGNDNPVVTGGGSGQVNPPYIITPFQAIRAWSPSTSYANSSDLQLAAQVAQDADVAIVFVSAWSSEGIDRDSLALSDTDNALISAVAAVQPKTIVCIAGPGAVLMPWVDSVSSIVWTGFPGQVDGWAIAAVLMGDVNPSGRLPLTFPVLETDIPVSTPEQYPGIDNEAEYSEALLVGYRWWDAKGIEPLFPFGHGLSYTSFAYSNLAVAAANGTVEITFQVQNVGALNGAEVSQLYIGFPSSSGEPPSQLRGFTKSLLVPQAVVDVSFTLDQQDLSIWDVPSHSWVAVHGQFSVWVGASSRDIRLSSQFTN